MKIGIVIGSPKAKDSNSEGIGDILAMRLSKENEVHKIVIPTSGEGTAQEYGVLGKCQAIIFLFPIYCDAIPAHMVAYLSELETFFKQNNKNDIMVYAFTNCGFYRGECGKISIEMLKVWTEKAGLTWGQGVGTGAGEMLRFVKGIPYGHGPNYNIGKLTDQFGANITNRKSDTEKFIVPTFPKILYELAANMLWISMCSHKTKNIRKLFKTTSVDQKID